MLIMLKEIIYNNTGSDTLEDRAINPAQIKDVSPHGDKSSIIEFVDGTRINVVGTVSEITKRINTNKKILKG